ncbi:hypothetical protein C6P45_000590 [Maudiozyma exigua]|uniref:Zn(2)-C6 fungal-type domain-containing protein n=1 Tax=Maudiozyma exigua TaxID=34358 RepID=A0A9P6WE56_MAUEX|nr:hypothetical protein C6P45_000590 [Kazachstania exigua]
MNNTIDRRFSGQHTSRKKRNRIPLSCTICRKRRLKCDKQKPSCSNCCLLNISHLCHYMRQTWAENDEEWSENDEIEFLSRKSDNLNQLIETSAALNKQQWPVMVNDHYIACYSNQIVINFNRDSAVVENEKPFWEDKFKYNPSDDPITILKSDPKLFDIWHEVIKLHNKLDEELDNNLSGKHRSDHLNSLSSSFRKEDVQKSKVNGSIQRRTPECKPQKNYNNVPLSKNYNDQQKGIQTNNENESHNLRKRNSIANLLNDVSNVNQRQRIELETDIEGIARDINNKEDNQKKEDLISKVDCMSHSPKNDIIDSLVHFLPSRLETELLIQTFFKQLYPSMPFLDSKNLNTQFHKIFSYDNSTVGNSALPENQLLTIKLSNYNDYCNLGIIVIIIKLTEISYSSSSKGSNTSLNDNSNNVDLDNDICQNSGVFSKRLPADLIILIEKDLIKINENLKDVYVPLPLIHFTLLCNIYCKSSNEIADSFRSSCSVENIVQLALTFGLNIDPDNYSLLNEHKFSNNNSNIPPNIERYKHTWRKTWYFIISLDVAQALDFGKTRLLKNLREISNTKLPIFSNVDYVKNIQELIVVKNFTLFFEIDLIIISILNLFREITYHSKTKLKLDVIIHSLVDLIYGRKSTKETLLILENLNILPKQEVWLRIHFSNNLNENYNLPEFQTLLHSRSHALNLTELERKLEIPRTSIITSVFFVKHIILRHLIFEFNWKSFTYLASSRSSEVLSNFYCREGFIWTKRILEDILYFHNEVLKSMGVGERIIIPPLLQALFTSVQFLTSLISTHDNVIDNNGRHLMDAITRLLEKISIYNERAGVIFDFIDNFNKIYLQGENSISTTSNLAVNQNVQVQALQTELYTPIVSHVSHQQQYIVPDRSIIATNISLIESQNSVQNVVKPNTIIPSGNVIDMQLPFSTYLSNQNMTDEQVLYSNPSRHWPHNVFDYNQNINRVPEAWTTLQPVSHPHIMQGTQQQNPGAYVPNPQVVTRSNNFSSYMMYPPVNNNVPVSSNQRPPSTANNTYDHTAAQFYPQEHTNFPGENNLQ